MAIHQEEQDEIVASAVKDALHALNAALDTARTSGLTADVKPNVVHVVGGPPIVTLSARLIRQRVEFDRKI